jgi:hypothetical protein
MRSEIYPYTDHVLDRLWRPGGNGGSPEVCLLLDSARDDRVMPLVRRNWIDHRCLFRGRLAPELAAAAPYVVSLGRRSTVTRAVVGTGWRQSLGVFVRSQAILQDLVRHFRQFLQVRDESGRLFFFRFYDPRVLRVYLPTCTPPELRTFFGPVELFSLEGEEEDTMLELSLKGGMLEQRIVYVGG